MFNTKEHKVESLQPCVQRKLFKLDSKEKIKKFCHVYILEKEFLNLNKYLVLMKYLDVNQEDRQKKTKLLLNTGWKVIWWGVRTIAPKENYPSVELRVSVGVDYARWFFVNSGPAFVNKGPVR